MKYADMAVPSRALHLWRYTPWTRIHPSKVEEVPNASPVSFTVGTGGELIEGAPRIIDAEDIGRVFLSELASQAYTVETSGEQNILRVEAESNGQYTVGHIHFVLKHDVAVILHLKGQSEWTGLHIKGDVGPNVRAAFGLVNDLDTETKLLHCEDWNVHRDATLELAALSIGGLRCKSDVRTRLTASGAAL
ncbi:MAG TPA: hypothetical protein D7I13_03720, partial [Candidatus Poseidoniales archaeon]